MQFTKNIIRGPEVPSSSKKNKRLTNAILSGSHCKSKLNALHLIEQFGDEQEKLQVKNELQLIAYRETK
jgi:hypothetical protein